METRDAMVFGFGWTIMFALIILSSIYVGHLISYTPPQPITVTAAPPVVSVNVPQAAPPKIEVTVPPRNVDVYVPPQAAPIVNVQPSPPQVQVIEKIEEKKEKAAVIK